jgi:fructose-1,6-bisphosphatase II
MSETPLSVCPCALFSRATEWAALASARWLGRDDQDAAEEAAEVAMLAGLTELPISGTVVIGPDSGEVLTGGSAIGAGGEAFDLAIDPLEGRGVVARGGTGAMSMIAVGPPGSLLRLPDMYMRRMAVGPRARGRIDLTRPVAENVAAVADAFGRNANDITALVLERPRHHDLIEEIRGAGARIKLMQDGDVTASISAAIRGTNDRRPLGGGAPLPRRRAPGPAVAHEPDRDRGRRRAWGGGRQPRLLLRGPRVGRGDRRRHRRLER